MSPLSLVLIAHVVCWLWTMAGSLDALQGANFRRAASGGLPAVATVAILEKARSSLDCSRRCLWPACCSYGYSQTARQCRLYSASHLGGFQAAEGFDFFVGCPVGVGGGCAKAGDCTGTANTECRSDVCQCQDGFRLDAGSGACVAIPIGDGCSSSVNCKNTANAECRDGTCQCVIGYHFYPGPDTCVAVCPLGYGDGFYKVTDHTIAGYQFNPCSTTSTETQCWDRCKTNGNCRTFEWDKNGKTCCLSDTTVLEQPQAYGYYPGWSYYQRNCA